MESVNDIADFVDHMFKNEEGYVYAPLKTATGGWQTAFFKWPAQREKLLNHLEQQSAINDVYVSPSLFKAPSDKAQAWKGTHHVWVEFDGNAPSVMPEGIPEPSIRLQSSEKGHEHWYWELDHFENSAPVIESLNKQLTYTLDADKSGWDASQVLRAPGTKHQESGKRVKCLNKHDVAVSFGDFRNLVTPREAPVALEVKGVLPEVRAIIDKYAWPEDASKLFHREKQPVGSRSSAMTRLAFHCVEMGMSNEECYVVLVDADDRWGKYKNRPENDRARRLVGIITHCRSKKELEAGLSLSEPEHFISLADFRRLDLKVKWLFENFLPEQGLGVISSLPGVGKSTLSIRLGMSVVLGQDFFGWKNANPNGKRVGFVSLEMGSLEVMKFIEDMWPSFGESDREKIGTEFFVMPLGYSLALNDPKAQKAMLEHIDKHELEFIIIDSLKAATQLDDEKVDKFFEWINKEVRAKRGCSVWLIHHNRKQGQDKRPVTLDDVYGSVFITAHATTAIALYRHDNYNGFELIPLKIRLAETPPSFMVMRGADLTFAEDSAFKPKDVRESDDFYGSFKQHIGNDEPVTGTNPFG